MKVASTINNYIIFMQENQERLYAQLMFPKLYDMPYDKAVQLDLFDNGRNYLRHSKGLLNKSNIQGKDRGKFKKGNTSGIRVCKNETTPEEDELKLDLDVEETEESNGEE